MRSFIELRSLTNVRPVISALAFRAIFCWASIAHKCETRNQRPRPPCALLLSCDRSQMWASTCNRRPCSPCALLLSCDLSQMWACACYRRPRLLCNRCWAAAAHKCKPLPVIGALALDATDVELWPLTNVPVIGALGLNATDVELRPLTNVACTCNRRPRPRCNRCWAVNAHKCKPAPVIGALALNETVVELCPLTNVSFYL